MASAWATKQSVGIGRYVLMRIGMANKSGVNLSLGKIGNWSLLGVIGCISSQEVNTPHPVENGVGGMQNWTTRWMPSL